MTGWCCIYNEATDTSSGQDLDDRTNMGILLVGIRRCERWGEPDNTLQNGADAVALYQANAVDFPNGTPVTAVNLIDAIVYDTSDADDPVLLQLLNQPTPGRKRTG
jgi:hypothetical protein